MIEILVQRDQANSLNGIHILGHAEYDQYGRDIVCAAVSAVAIGTANAIEELFGVKIYSQHTKKGDLELKLPKEFRTELEESNVRLLLEAMLISLKHISAGYPENLRIKSVNL